MMLSTQSKHPIRPQPRMAAMLRQHRQLPSCTSNGLFTPPTRTRQDSFVLSLSRPCGRCEQAIRARLLVRHPLYI